MILASMLDLVATQTAAECGRIGETPILSSVLIGIQTILLGLVVHLISSVRRLDNEYRKRGD